MPYLTIGHSLLKVGRPTRRYPPITLAFWTAAHLPSIRIRLLYSYSPDNPRSIWLFLDGVSRPTYCQIDLASFGDLFG
jgi:hypothetical protein